MHLAGDKRVLRVNFSWKLQTFPEVRPSLLVIVWIFFPNHIYSFLCIWILCTTFFYLQSDKRLEINAFYSPQPPFSPCSVRWHCMCQKSKPDANFIYYMSLMLISMSLTPWRCSREAVTQTAYFLLFFHFSQLSKTRLLKKCLCPQLRYE